MAPNSHTPDRFAFGDNTVGDYACPVLAAGKDPSGMLLEVAELYDENARLLADADEGTLDADTAREAWERTIDDLHRNMREATNQDIYLYWETQKAEADEVKREVFDVDGVR